MGRKSFRFLKSLSENSPVEPRSEKFRIHFPKYKNDLVKKLYKIFNRSVFENKIVCAGIAGLLHYFFLAAFFWMFLEAFQILWLLIKIFKPKQSHFIKFYIVGFGFPALIVAITAGVKHTGYGTSQYCWLNPHDGTIWGFIGPVLLILVFNSFSLVYALYKTQVIVRKKPQLEGVKMWVRGAAVLMPLLGVTWVVGFFYAEKQSLMFAYIFALLNSLQGVGIFLFHCILNRQVKENLARTWKRQSLFTSSFARSSTRLGKLNVSRESPSPKRGIKPFDFARKEKSEGALDTSSPKPANEEDSEQSIKFLPPDSERRDRLDTNELYPLEVEKG